MARWENQARQRERRLAELEQELLEKSSRVETLNRQLDESRRRQEETEQKLSLRLQECEVELVRRAAAAPTVRVREGSHDSGSLR